MGIMDKQKVKTVVLDRDSLEDKARALIREVEDLTQRYENDRLSEQETYRELEGLEERFKEVKRVNRQLEYRFDTLYIGLDNICGEKLKSKYEKRVVGQTQLENKERIKRDIQRIISKEQIGRDSTCFSDLNKIWSYFRKLSLDETETYENIVVDEYLSCPLRNEDKEEHVANCERILYGIYLWARMGKISLARAIRKTVQVLESPEIDLNDELHKRIVKYASHFLAAYKPDKESYDTIERHIDSCLFYDLLAYLMEIDENRAMEHDLNIIYKRYDKYKNVEEGTMSYGFPDVGGLKCWLESK